MNVANNVLKVKDCTGCGLCSFVCPKDAIKISESPENNHFNYPQINKDKCISCGVCLKRCPTYNKIQKSFDTNKKVYYFRLQNQQRLLKSSSGGAFQAIVNEFYDDKTIIYGATWDGLKVCHKRIDDIHQLDLLLSSKYIQSYIDKSIYKSIKEDLKNGYKVIFSGTPCQIAAVHTLLNESERENILLIEILCHGVPNQWGFDKCIEYEERIIKGQITEFGFRYKIDNNLDNRKFYYRYHRGDKKYKVIGDYAFFPFYKYFHTYSIYRDSCYKCNYRENRFSDLVIGDFWGATKVLNNLISGWSNSFIVPLSEKGQEIIQKIGVVTNVTINDVFRFNESFLKDRPPEMKYISFYNKLSSIKWYKWIRSSSLRNKIIIKIKNIIKMLINLFLPKQKKRKLSVVTYYVNKE